MIPAFAIDRTEVVLHALVRLRREGRIPDVPVVVDGPMSLAAMDVYRGAGDELAPRSRSATSRRSICWRRATAGSRRSSTGAATP
ncbi:hypothetical protein [Tessaracoccus coleopterorum]|uniref:hypothetical protein n=1 Tax=Tessaracoccus coleopterorum TaxID=2714950 RepID=UPI001E4DAF25|nr:hypothetical protein [Tessaracoccus coleopterorum]